VPLSEKGDSIIKVSLSNNKTCLFIDHISELIEFVFDSDEDAKMKNIWTKMMEDYQDAMAILRNWSVYAEHKNKGVSFKKIDDFFVAYVERSGSGKEGVTNYIHVLGSAHVSYHMRWHSNLYKYSQQRWESLNEKLKLAFLTILSKEETLDVKELRVREPTLSPYFCTFSWRYCGLQV
jgi:hypothetical protein